eukprot:8328051-Pyramimonas_sp.AAC.1
MRSSSTRASSGARAAGPLPAGARGDGHAVRPATMSLPSPPPASTRCRYKAPSCSAGALREYHMLQVMQKRCLYSCRLWATEDPRHLAAQCSGLPR